MTGGSIGLPTSGEEPQVPGGWTADADLLACRADFPALATFTWLQNGGVTLVPRPVHETHLRYLDEAYRRGPLHIAWPEEEYPRRAASRARIAAFLGAAADQVAITRGVTGALAHILRTVQWDAGDELVISDDEEGAILIPALQLRDLRGVRVRRIPLLPDASPDAILDGTRALVGPRTRLIAISHVTTDWGVRLPAAEICAVAEREGVPVFLDLAHSAGTLPVDLPAIGASYAGAVSYKWMLAPYAAGALYLRADRVSSTPVLYAGNRAEAELDHERLSVKLHPDARRFEAGPWSWPLIHAWAAGLDYLETLGVDRIADRAARLGDRLIEGLAELPRVTIHTPRAPDQRAALIAFGVAGWTGPALERHLRDVHAIVVRALMNRLDGVRASVAFFTLDAEVDALIDAITRLPAAPWASPITRRTP